MTRYAAQPPRYPGLPEHWDVSETILIEGFDYVPSIPNQDDSFAAYKAGDTYRPVTLEWHRPRNGIYATKWQATNGHRGNRVYTLTGPGATNTSMIMVNGVIIPVEFNSDEHAKLFAQAIEDANTED